jgi:hypothetical protein
MQRETCLYIIILGSFTLLSISTVSALSASYQIPQEDSLILYLPLDGDANDQSQG